VLNGKFASSVFHSCKEKTPKMRILVSGPQCVNLLAPEFGILDITDIIEKKRLQWYGHVKRMQDERIPKLILEWLLEGRRKRGHPRKTWMEGVQAAMTARNLEQDQWRNREEWRLVSGRRR
jgi:hypothetical protein